MMKNIPDYPSNFTVNHTTVGKNYSAQLHLIMLSDGVNKRGFRMCKGDGIYYPMQESELKSVSEIYFDGEEGRKIIESKDKKSTLASLINFEGGMVSEDQINLLNSFIPSED
jgi:hypothetical protein